MAMGELDYLLTKYKISREQLRGLMTEPLLDVIIPVHDNLAWLVLCTQALRNFTKNPYRLILVDNASEDRDTRDYFEKRARLAVDDLVVICLATNESFSSAVNAGLNVAKAPHVVILNSDVIVQPGWDAAVVAELSDPAIGMVGLRTACSGAQATHPPGSDVRYLIFCAVAARRKVLDLVGPLDGETCVGWGGGEDLDYSWRIREKGFRLVVSQAQAFHGVSKTYETAGVSPLTKAKLEAGNMERLKSKWGAKFVQKNTQTAERIAVGILSYDEKTWVKFCQSLVLQRQLVSNWETYWVTRTPVHHGRERIAVEVTQRGDFAYLWFVDDDMVFPQLTLERLLRTAMRRPDVDIVGALAYKRSPPYETCVFTHARDPEGGEGFLSMDGIEHTGLRECDAIGFGSVLIKTKVFESLKRPWFQWDKFGEDMGFCWAAKQAGFRVWCDTGLVIGHIGAPALVSEGLVQEYRQSQEPQE